MKIKADWILPDLKQAQKRTKKEVERIDHFEIPENARFIGQGKNIIFQLLVVRQMNAIRKLWREF